MVIFFLLSLCFNTDVTFSERPSNHTWSPLIMYCSSVCFHTQYLSPIALIHFIFIYTVFIHMFIMHSSIFVLSEKTTMCNRAGNAVIRLTTMYPTLSTEAQ